VFVFAVYFNPLESLKIGIESNWNSMATSATAALVDPVRWVSVE
jgi:hypothetical protein